MYGLVAVACDADADDGVPPAVRSAPAQGTGTQDIAAQGTACSYTRPRGVADTRQTIMSNGIERQYLLHVPATYPLSYDGLAPAPAPLLIAFHGGGVPAQSIVDLTAVAAASDQHGMVTVFPEGMEQVWNAHGSPAPTVDTGFIADLIAQVETTLCIDAHRVYAAGFSIGGSMALLFGCAHPDLVAAVAIVAAPYVSCQGNVPIVAFHGDADPIAPYEGRPASATGDGGLPAVAQAVSDWASALDCEATPTVSRAAADVELATYGGCASGGEDALLYTVLGGGHAWPGAVFDFPREITGLTTHSISATELILTFFASHARSNARPQSRLE
ncbi:MAG: PHB depolymerase family esterase [Dehalococcoidia bacterium]